MVRGMDAHGGSRYTCVHVQSLQHEPPPRRDPWHRRSDAGRHRQYAAAAGHLPRLPRPDRQDRRRGRPRNGRGAMGHAGAAAVRRCADHERSRYEERPLAKLARGKALVVPCPRFANTRTRSLARPRLGSFDRRLRDKVAVGVTSERQHSEIGDPRRGRSVAQLTTATIRRRSRQSAFYARANERAGCPAFENMWCFQSDVCQDWRAMPDDDGHYFYAIALP